MYRYIQWNGTIAGVTLTGRSLLSRQIGLCSVLYELAILVWSERNKGPGAMLNLDAFWTSIRPYSPTYEVLLHMPIGRFRTTRDGQLSVVCSRS